MHVLYIYVKSFEPPKKISFETEALHVCFGQPRLIFKWNNLPVVNHSYKLHGFTL